MKNGSRKSLFLMLVSVAMVAPLASCGGPSSGGDKIDPNKTTLRVYNWDGGYGTDWLRNLKARFEEKYKGKSYEEGKTGVQLIIDADKANTAMASITSFDTSKEEVFFTESVNYTSFVKAQGGTRFLDITDIVEETSDLDGKTIESKMNEPEKAFLKQNDKYYAIPHYSGFYGLIYNVDIFDQNNFYLDEDGEITAISGKAKSVGPDLQAGTSDDGLPQTYDQFFYLCEYIAAQGVYPVHWTGEYFPLHLASLMRSLAVDYDGYDVSCLRITFNGTVTDAVKMNAGKADITLNGNHATAIGTEEASVSDSRGQRNAIYRTAGNYYGAEFIQRLINSNGGSAKFYTDTAFKDTYSHLNAQEDFVKSGTKYATYNNNKPVNYAMLVDGPWWECEATSTFTSLGKEDPSLSKKNRRFGWMPFPSATQDKVGQPRTLADHLQSFAFAKANLSDAKAKATKDLLKFAYSDDELVHFTQDTGVKRNLSYEIPSSAYNEMSYYEKSLAQYMDSCQMVFSSADTNYYQTNSSVLTSAPQYYTCTVDGKSQTPAAAFKSNPSLTAKEWFEAFASAKAGD